MSPLSRLQLVGISQLLIALLVSIAGRSDNTDGF